MKGFRFRLARVLRVRALEEEVAREEWGAAEARALSAEEEARRLDEGLREARSQLNDQASCERLDVRARLAGQSSVDQLELRRAFGRRKAGELREATEAPREAWESSRMAVEGLERLSHRALKRFRAEREHDENALADEVALRRSAASGKQALEADKKKGPRVS